ncbi:transposase family protein, partial [Pueribacillus sp. YX66]|uniref:transposase family protein n=1 Tax=Pueribacillus sp. YX66 TaxID=3229242 RepID=UPI00358D48EF
MLTRKEKRNREKNKNYFFDLLKIQHHFFKDFIKQLNKVKDPRHQGYITYGPETILYTILLKSIIGIDTMRNMTVHFNTDECIENVKTALSIDELEELPHYDTINDFLSKLEMEELEKIRTYMIKALLKKRCFESYRILDKYWPIIVDGTGLHTFREKHCEHCLRREYKDEETGETTTVYMHHVLEAKLVVGNMVFSVASEFIENESEDTPKQDCELNAFKRLAKNLKQT